jgi:hypothetical protein
MYVTQEVAGACAGAAQRVRLLCGYPRLVMGPEQFRMQKRLQEKTREQRMYSECEELSAAIHVIFGTSVGVAAKGRVIRQQRQQKAPTVVAKFS